MSEVEQALADVKPEGDTDPFAALDTEKETPSDSPAEKQPEDEESKDKPAEGEEGKPDNTPDEDVPFHKHPRWIERETELKTLRERDEQTARELEELKAFKEEVSGKLSPSDTDIPDWFKELYGENGVAWKKYEAREREREIEIERNIIARQTEAQAKAQEEAKRWNKWVDDEITKLQEEGKQFERNELIKTMLDYRPTDEQGNFDFKKGYEIYEALKRKEDPAHSQARKQIADISTKSSKSDKESKGFLTTSDLRGKPWHSL